MKTNKISINDFSFKFAGYGHYIVTYTSQKTGKKWKKTISDMIYIDLTKNSESPKRCDLEELKRMCKN